MRAFLSLLSFLCSVWRTLLFALLAACLLAPHTASGKVANEEVSLEVAFPKTTLLPPPLPVTGRRRAGELLKPPLSAQDNRQSFRMSYVIAEPFAVASLASRKPVQSSERFKKLSRMPDPIEKLNRAAFRTTLFVDKIFTRPLAKAWRKIPRPLTAPIINFARNLSRTTDFLNALLQGNVKRASEVFFSFVLDSTIGFGGLINLSEKLGIPQVEEDFGQTLAHYGIGHGTYFVSMLTGPSSLRDSTGRTIDILGNIYGKRALGPYWNPLDYLLFIETGAGAGVSTGVSIGLSFLRGIDSYSRALDQIEALKKGSLDFYTASKRFYAYQRALEVLNAEASAPQDSPELQEDDPFADIEE